MSDRVAVLFDTDIGTDIDDAVALAYLLRQPRCELVGITTASGAQQERARLADMVCRAGGREDIPIHCGPEPSLLRGVRQPEAKQAEALASWPHRESFPPATAIEWLRQTIRARPGELTLLAVGPLTNVGLLFAVDPEIPSLLKDVVIMGGRFLPDRAHGPWAEWNIRCDPEAAAIVYERAPAGMRSVGLDVTLRCRMPAEQVRERFGAAGGPLAAVLDLAEVWFRHAQMVTFHDPLAAACLFAPELCEWTTGRVRVELGSDLVPALTHFEPGAHEPNRRIASSVAPERFFAHYFEVTG